MFETQSLKDLCSLVADVGLECALKCALRFEQLLMKYSDMVVDKTIHNEILTVFAFMNYTIANGIWSNLENEKLRRDLMEQSSHAYVLKIARTITESDNSYDIAYRAVFIGEQLQLFIMQFTKAVNVSVKNEMDADSNISMYFAFEWIKDKLELSDKQLNCIALEMLPDSNEFIDPVEKIALELNLAACKRQKNIKGI